MNKSVALVLSSGGSRGLAHNSANTFDFYKTKELIELGENVAKKALQKN